MATETLDQLIERVKALSVEEQVKLRDAINRLLSDEVDRRLLARGVISRIPPPPTEAEIEAYRSYKPVPIQGKPLSETIIEERR